MKIVCDSCATKYSISDDKVRGKVFKIRCKKCSHIIVVRGTQNDGAAAGAAAPASEGGWHLVVNGDQVGPLPETDVRERIARGEVNAETYVWKDGFADWVKLSAVDEFADDLSAIHAVPTSSDAFADHSGSNGASQATDSSTGDVLAPASSAQSGGLFGSISVAPAVAGSDLGGRASLSSSSPAPSDLGGGDLFAAPAAAPAADENRWGNNSGGLAAAGHDGGRIENLTAQRHENSVLFSLSNLQSLASPGAPARPSGTSGPTPAPGSEGSGLIDIRAMAASTLGAPAEGHGGGGEDLPSFGAFSPAAPVLLSLPTRSGPPKWIYPAIGLILVLVGTIGVMAWKLLAEKPAPVVEAPPPASAPIAAAPAPAKAATEPAAAAPSTPSSPPPAAQPAIPDDKLPPREPPKTEAAAAAPARPDRAGKKGKGKGSRLLAASDAGDRRTRAAPTAAAPAPSAPEPEKRPAKGSLDDLLESAISGKSKPAKSRADDELKKPVADPATAGPLSKNAVVAGMNGVKGRIGDCYNQYKVPGMVMVNVIIGKNGKVSSATAQGKFAGTPTGTCVEKAVKTASFPPSDGLTTPYPFVLK